VFRAKGSPSLVTVIKNDDYGESQGESSKSPLVWKFTQEDFNTKSQLIVNANEEAVFYRDGSAVGVFTGGRHTLTTQNYPFLTALTKKFTDGVSAFNAKIYFVNKAHKLELKWGTETPIEVRDPKWGIQTSVQARGSYSVQIINSQKFIEKLVDNNVKMLTTKELNDEFRSAISQDIRVAISKAVKDLPPGYELMDLSNDLDTIAAVIKPRVAEKFYDYGAEVVNFYVAAIDIPTKDDDADRSKISEAFSDNAVMGILGDNWTRQQAVTISKDLANNSGSGGMAGAFAGAGLGMGVGGAFGTMAGQVFNPQQNGENAQAVAGAPATQPAPSVGAEAPQGVTCECGHVSSGTSKFCAECGATLAATAPCQSCSADISKSAKFCPECGVTQTR
jgi:membrane protease subunit (stomatin/prohibitin family)